MKKNQIAVATKRISEGCSDTTVLKANSIVKLAEDLTDYRTAVYTNKAKNQLRVYSRELRPANVEEKKAWAKGITNL